jgi:predicted Rossmann-fold nucleotide-binding protein
VVLFDSQYWEGFLNWLKSSVLAKGFISEADVKHLTVSDHPDEVVEAVQKWYIKHEVVGRRALRR